MAFSARYAGRCGECQKPYPVGEPIERQNDRWIHASCAAQKRTGPTDGDGGGITTKYPGHCRICDSPYAAGARIGSLWGVWAHHSCVEAEQAKIADALTRGSPEDRLEKILGYVQMIWPDCTSPETDIRVQKTGPDSWFLHARPTTDTVDGREFRKRVPALYDAAASALADFAAERWDERYPDYVSFPDDEL